MAETGKPADGAQPAAGAPQNVDADDLDLVSDELEDAGKDEAELWSEFDRAEAATDGGASPEKSGEEAAEAAAEGADDTDDGSAPADAKPQGEAPATDDRSADAADPGQTQGNDLWASATPEQKAAFEAAQTQLRKLEQAERSNRGRLSAMQRQLNDFTAGRDPSPPAARKAADGQGNDGKADGGFLASDKWKRFEGEYPEVAGPLGELIGDLQSQLKRQDTQLSAIGNERREDALDEQEELLLEAHPDWEQVTEKPEFGPWLVDQPRHIREAALRNGDGVVDAEEAADVLSRFKSYLKEQSDGSGQEPAGDGAGADTDTGTDPGNGKPQLSGKRQRQLESASGARSRGRPGVTSNALPPEDGDPELIWKKFDEMEARQDRRA